MIVQHFIEDGYYERHLNKTRALYKNRHDVLIDALKPLADICAISGEHAGVHILLTFEKGWNENELIERAKKEDILSLIHIWILKNIHLLLWHISETAFMI